MSSKQYVIFSLGSSLPLFSSAFRNPDFCSPGLVRLYSEPLSHITFQKMFSDRKPVAIAVNLAYLASFKIVILYCLLSIVWKVVLYFSSFSHVYRRKINPLTWEAKVDPKCIYNKFQKQFAWLKSCFIIMASVVTWLLVALWRHTPITFIYQYDSIFCCCWYRGLNSEVLYHSAAYSAFSFFPIPF